MSRKKIVAATMTAAALGLAFAGYTATRANGTEELPLTRSLPLKADAGYRQNHQVEHNGAVFEWMDAAASLNHTDARPSHDELPVIGKDLVAAMKEDEELAPVIIEHANRVGADFRGFGLASGGGGGTPKGADEWGGGGRYASSFGGFGGFASFGGGGGYVTKGASGSNDISGDKPHQDAPAGSNDGPGDKPGSADPKEDTPPAGGPNPPTQEQTKDPTDIVNPPGGPTNPVPPKPGDDHPPTGPHTDVPEPATLGLLGFGILAAGALRRRRRSS